MRTTIAIVTCLVACGGGGKKKVEEPPTVVEKRQEEPPPPEPPPPAEPPVPKNFSAKAMMEPVKGAKQPAAAVSFTQLEGAATDVSSDFLGLKKGTYHLVIHDGTECGPNATKAGPPWKGGEAVKLKFK